MQEELPNENEHSEKLGGPHNRHFSVLPGMGQC
jgi:hypothetical protein